MITLGMMQRILQTLTRCLRPLVWCCLLLPGVSGAQTTTYPIQVNANLLPPYTPYLSDYYSGTREKLTVSLINRDQFNPTLSVRLRIIITAPGGVRVQTNDRAFFEPIQVDHGAPLRLTQDDLAPYFQPQNLLTQGTLASGRLPEGMIEFCFQAIEAYTGQVLSTSSCARAWIISQKPPLLSLPRNQENIVFREPLNVLFQWTPLQQGLTGVEYDFILKELWDNGMAPQAAFPYAPEIYRETTRSTSVLYGAMQPQLLAGKRYAWCVRAKVREGMDELNLFQNDGYTEVRTFVVQDNCVPIQFVTATAEKKRLNLEWTPLSEHIGFTVSYRLVKSMSTNGNVDAAEWKEQAAQDPRVTLYGLQSGAMYQYRVGSYCMAGQPVYTEVMSITLPNTDSARLAQCGIMHDVSLTNREPLKELKSGDVIKASDYPVTITKVSGANGNFTGEGWTMVPWLNDAKIAVQFTSITVNSDHQLIEGYIDAKYDKNEGQIADLDDVFEGGADVGLVKTGITHIDYTFDFSIPGVEAFSLNDEGELVIEDSEGTSHTVEPSDKSGEGNEGNKVVVFPMTVKDKDGQVYQVEKVTEPDGAGGTREVVKATYIGKAGQPLAEGSFTPDQLDGDKAIVTFSRGDGYYAFDTWLDYYENVSLIKEKYQKLYTGYYAPWKLLPTGKTDQVTAMIVITDPSIKAANVIFKTPKGTEYKAEFDGEKTYTLNLAAGPAGDVQELYALYAHGKDKFYTLGKLNIASYAPQTHKVVLVPVKDVTVDKDAIAAKLRETYAPLGITWDVVLDANFAFTGNDRLMANSTGVRTYNEDMRALNSAYQAKAADKFDAAANYLFFLKATGSNKINSRDLTGFMPRGGQFGYIFTSEIGDVDEPVTVAHELGHGRWKLYHTFDEHYGGYKRGETDNLMDYHNGNLIAKWQWDVINDPALLVNVFEGDEKSELAAGINLVMTDFDEGAEDQSVTSADCQTDEFLTPYGKVIALSADRRKSITSYRFQRGKLFGFTDTDGNVYVSSLSVAVKTLEKSETIKDKVISKSITSTYDLVQFVCFDCVDASLKQGNPYRISLEEVKEKDGTKIVYTNIPDRFKFRFDKFKSCAEGTFINYRVDEGTKALRCRKLVADDCISTGIRGGTGADGEEGKSVVRNLTDRAIDVSTIASLLGGKKSIDDSFGGKRHTLIVKFFITDQVTLEKHKDWYSDVEKARPGGDTVKIWIHHDGKNWTLKEGPTSNIDQLAAYYKSNGFTLSMGGLFSALGDGLNDLCSGLYEVFDWVSGGGEHLRIPEYVWNCNHASYNPVYAKVYRYISAPLAPAREIVQWGINELARDYPEVQAIASKAELHQIEFAALCGVWNGVVDILKAVPELLKFAASLGKDGGLNDLKKKYEQLKSYEREEDGQVVSSGAWGAIKDGFAESFDINKPCQFAHNISSIVLGIAITAVQPELGESLIARFAAQLVNILKTLDAVAEMLNPLSHVFKYSLKFVGKISSQSFKVLVKGTKQVLYHVDNGYFIAKLYVKAASEWRLVTFPSKQFAAIQEGADGFMYMKSDNTFNGMRIAPLDELMDEALKISKELADALKSKGIAYSKLETLLRKVPGEEGGVANALLKMDLGSADNLQNFVDDLIIDADFLKYFKDNKFVSRDLGGAWEVLINRPAMRKDSRFLTSVMNCVSNSSLANLGLDSKALKDIADALKKDFEVYKNTVTDLNDNIFSTIENFGDFLKKNPGTQFENFDKVLGDLTRSGDSWQTFINRKGSHWIIKDISDDVQSFGGKKIKLNSTQNVGGNNYYVDVEVDGNPPIFFEYKSGANTIVKQEEFIREFVKRDLSNGRILDLDQIRWRKDVADPGLEKRIIGYLKSADGINSLNDAKNLSAANSAKFQTWFDLESASSKITADDVEFFIQNHFSKIFRTP